MGALDDLQRLGLAVGRIVAVEEHAGARAPSFVVTIDLGPQGQHQSTVPQGDYSAGDLMGRQIVCVRDGDEILVLSAQSHAGGHVLLQPDRDVEEGSIVA